MASDSWFRMYNTAVDNPKVMLLTDAQFRAWITLLSLASKMGGIIPDSMNLIALALRKSAPKASETLQVLLSAELVDRVELGYQPHNWNERQFKADLSTERVKRFRERNLKRNETVSETVPETEAKAETKKKKVNLRATRFEEFWLSCPKKTGRGPAEKAYLKAIVLVDEETLITAMKRYAETQIGKDRAYIKTPGPWLNEKRWTDEGIAPAGPVDEAAAASARAIWDGKAAPLVDTIGEAKFSAWFSGATFDPGPPTRIRFQKPFARQWVDQHYGSELRRIYGEISLEVAA